MTNPYFDGLFMGSILGGMLVVIVWLWTSMRKRD